MRGRGAVRYVVYLLLFLSGTAIFLISTFPGGRMAEMLNARMKDVTGGVLSMDSAAFVFPLSLKVTGLDAMIGGAHVNLGNAMVSFGLKSFVGHDRSAGIVLKGPWGELPVTLEKEGRTWHIKGRGKGIELARIPGGQNLPVKLSGRLSLDVDLDVDSDGKGKISGKGNARVGDASLSGGAMDILGAGSLGISRALVFWTVKDNLLTLGETTVQGDIIGDARGTALLFPSNIKNSRLNMTLSLRPSASSRKRLAPLFLLAGARAKTDGSVTVQVRGTVGNPKISL
ncbi:MAG: type II secretion system protein GspN, partial [Deltaproteobacteria bacterium]|nr:type II secretion system protein GspN [Deltaproteobacteria bacterium]